MNLTLDERTKIFDKVCRLVETKHFNPAMNGVDWNALARSRKDQIVACTDPEAFEKEVNRLPGCEIYQLAMRSMRLCIASR